MSKDYESARRLKRISAVLVPAVWLGGLWLVTEWVGKGLFGLEGVWAWVVGGLCTMVGVPVVAGLVYFGFIFLYPVVSGKRIDWR